MKKSIYLFITAAVFGLTGLKASAQDYRTAVGVKFGPFEIGPSIKYFFDKDQAVEGILGFRSGGAVITGLYEKHVPVFDVDKLKFYYGGGAHIGGIDRGTYNDGHDVYTDKRIKIGLDGLIGLEYVIPESPIVVGIDLDPRIEFATGSTFDIGPALNIRYAF